MLLKTVTHLQCKHYGKCAVIVLNRYKAEQLLKY